MQGMARPRTTGQVSPAIATSRFRDGPTRLTRGACSKFGPPAVNANGDVDRLEKPIRRERSFDGGLLLKPMMPPTARNCLANEPNSSMPSLSSEKDSAGRTRWRSRSPRCSPPG